MYCSTTHLMVQHRDGQQYKEDHCDGWQAYDGAKKCVTAQCLSHLEECGLLLKARLQK